jgi:hypothetical protein
MRQITFLQSSLDPACAECDDKLAEVAALTSTLDMLPAQGLRPLNLRPSASSMASTEAPAPPATHERADLV